MGQISGDLSVMSLSDLIIWFANRGSSGTLVVERGTLRKEFALDAGTVIRASSSDPREYLGQFLVHFGLITEDQLSRAFTTQGETNVLLGRILVMIGIVPEDQVIQTLRVKIAESLLDTYRWTTGRFQFTDSPGVEDQAEVSIAVNLLELHREGLRRTAMWQELARIFPSQTLQLAVNEARVPPTMTRETLDGRILALARQGHNIEAISLELHATDYQIAARLYELHRLGMIEPHPGYDLTPVTEDTELDHATLARQALAKRDYGSAYHHLQASDETDWSGLDMPTISKEIEVKYRADLQSEIVSPEAVPSLVRQPEGRELKKMSAKQRYILARIDAKRSVSEIIQVSPMRDIDALEIIRNFKRDGMIRL